MIKLCRTQATNNKVQYLKRIQNRDLYHKKYNLYTAQFLLQVMSYQKFLHRMYGRCISCLNFISISNYTFHSTNVKNKNKSLLLIQGITNLCEFTILAFHRNINEFLQYKRHNKILTLTQTSRTTYKNFWDEWFQKILCYDNQ